MPDKRNSLIARKQEYKWVKRGKDPFSPLCQTVVVRLVIILSIQSTMQRIIKKNEMNETELEV